MRELFLVFIIVYLSGASSQDSDKIRVLIPALINRVEINK